MASYNEELGVREVKLTFDIEEGNFLDIAAAFDRNFLKLLEKRNPGVQLTGIEGMKYQTILVGDPNSTKSISFKSVPDLTVCSDDYFYFHWKIDQDSFSFVPEKEYRTEVVYDNEGGSTYERSVATGDYIFKGVCCGQIITKSSTYIAFKGEKIGKSLLSVTIISEIDMLEKKRKMYDINIPGNKAKYDKLKTEFNDISQEIAANNTCGSFLILLSCGLLSIMFALADTDYREYFSTPEQKETYWKLFEEMEYWDEYPFLMRYINKLEKGNQKLLKVVVESGALQQQQSDYNGEDIPYAEPI